MKNTMKTAALLLTACLLLAGLCLPAWAEDTVTVYLDGANTGVTMTPDQRAYESVPYVELARAMGMETWYDWETNTIHSRGETREIAFALSDYTTATLWENGEERQVRLSLRTLDGKCYISNDSVYDLFGHRIERNGAVIDLYNVERIAAQVQNRVPLLAEYFEVASLPANHHTDLTAGLSIEAVSELFGLKITGGTETRAAIDRRDSELSIDLTCDCKGITHLFDFFYRTRPADAFEQYRVDMDKPITAQLYIDPDAVYLKSDILVPFQATGACLYAHTSHEEYNQKVREQHNKLYERITGRWLRMDRTESFNRQLERYIGFLERPNLEDTLVLLTSRSITSCHSDYDRMRATEGSSYPAVMAYIDALCNVLEQAFTKREAAQEAAYTVRLGDDILRKSIGQAGLYGKTRQKEFDDLFAVTTFSIGHDATITPAHAVTLDGKLDWRMTNLPNEWDIPFGTLSVNGSYSQSTKPGAGNPLDRPADYIVYETIENELMEEIFGPQEGE